MKSEIIEQLGQSDLLLPALVAEGLAANDRVKIRLSLLQAAARHARDPKGPRFDLTENAAAPVSTRWPRRLWSTAQALPRASA